MPNNRSKQLKAFERLLDIMDDLREKCPWDRKQTFHSLRNLTIEEVYELGDAILDNQKDEIKKELGDILLHIVFYAKIGSETKDFDIADICNSICGKLIARHPHIFGEAIADNEDEVKRNWEKLKLQEGNKSVLSGVPRTLPAMVKATRIQDKVKGVGFDWETPDQVWEKVEEEMNEFKNEVAKNNQRRMEEELGDVFFSLINYARFMNINPEDALEKTNRKFIHRFQKMEKNIIANGENITDLNLQQLDKYWEKVKAEE